MVKKSIEILKLVAKVFSIKTSKENFFINSLEKIKTKVEDNKNEEDEF